MKAVLQCLFEERVGKNRTAERSGSAITRSRTRGTKPWVDPPWIEACWEDVEVKKTETVRDGLSSQCTAKRPCTNVWKKQLNNQYKMVGYEQSRTRDHIGCAVRRRSTIGMIAVYRTHNLKHTANMQSRISL